MIPKDKITNSIDGNIKIVGKCKNYPIYYAECNVGNYQNYMLCCDMYSDDVQASSNININANKCGIQIENFNDIKEGDIIEAYIMEQVKQ